MRAGSLRFRIDIEQPADIPPRTASGGIDKNSPDYWEPYLGSVPADEVPQTGREYAAAMAIYSEMNHMFRLRLDLGINTKMRVLFFGTAMDILSAQHFRGRRNETVLICKEGKSKGN